MNKFKKFGLFAGVLLIGAATLTSCTKSFCTVSDQAAIMYSYEKYDASDKDHDTYAEGSKTQEIVATAKSSGKLTPSDAFNAFIEAKIVEEAQWLMDNVYTEANGYDATIYTLEYARGQALFAGGEDRSDVSSYSIWYNFDKWVGEARKDVSEGGVGLLNCPDQNYLDTYKNTFNVLTNNVRTCISPETRNYNGVVIEGTSWGEAFNFGLIEGLLVYPVSWLIYTFTNSFAFMGGFGTLLAVFLVTLIVRGILILATFKQTLSQNKMTALQPELAKIQAKYPNANTNTYEKQKMGQEQMALYKKHKINPFGMFIILIFQFPIFIAVWAAMQGSSILMTGDLFGLSFATTTSAALINFQGPWYVAWIIFILMAAAQFFSMKIPQWKQKKAQQATQKLGKNPAQTQQAKTMSIVNNVMVIMIIVMGLSLPIAMAIYWFISALISLGQTLLMQYIAKKHAEKQKYAKYKSK
jgi:YidC/Oxa1 family membrane protein insertase